MRTKGPEPADIGLSDDQCDAVRAALEHLLASPSFRNSRQSQRFLRYVVEHRLHGQDDLLKERNIGVEVFERAPDYDTGEDPIVRVRATEIRKRLAQYYQGSTDSEEVRLDLPSGSYRIEFHFPEEKHAPIAPKHTRWPIIGVTVAGVLTLIALGVWAGWLFRPQDTVQQFWAPALASSKPVLIYCGQPVVYFLSKEVHEEYRQTHPDHQRGSLPVLLAPDAVLHGRDIIPVTEQFVGIGNANAAALLSSMFASRGKAVELRYANDLSFGELRSAPAVLIGGFSNLWTLEMTGQLRFVFQQDQRQRRIFDQSTKKSYLLKDLAPDGKSPEDYAIVSRLTDSATGQMLIAAAGITQYGTRAAGEFLTNGDLLRTAQAQWQKKNVQVLLHTTVYKGTPSKPTVVAVETW